MSPDPGLWPLLVPVPVPFIPGRVPVCPGFGVLWPGDGPCLSRFPWFGDVTVIVVVLDAVPLAWGTVPVCPCLSLFVPVPVPYDRAPASPDPALGPPKAGHGVPCPFPATIPLLIPGFVPIFPESPLPLSLRQPGLCFPCLAASPKRCWKSPALLITRGN